MSQTSFHCSTPRYRADLFIEVSAISSGLVHWIVPYLSLIIWGITFHCPSECPSINFTNATYISIRDCSLYLLKILYQKFSHLSKIFVGFSACLYYRPLCPQKPTNPVLRSFRQGKEGDHSGQNWTGILWMKTTCTGHYTTERKIRNNFDTFRGSLTFL